MSVSLTFIEYFGVLMMYYILFVEGSKNIKLYLIKAIIYSIVLTISSVYIYRSTIGASFITLAILMIVTTIKYKKNIIVNIAEIAIVFLIIAIIELFFTVIIHIIFKDIDIPEIGYAFILVTLMTVLIYGTYKIIKNKELDLDCFISKYSNIILICINSIIFVAIIKILIEKNLIVVDIILEIGILCLAVIGINVYFFFDLYRKNKESKKCEIKESINPLIQELIDEMKASEHEYKNHLNILYCMIQVCKTDELKDKAKKYIGDVFENKNLLNTLSDIENTILKAVLLSKINQAEKYEVHCEYNIENELKNIPLDDSELTVVLSNLLNNAIEATKNTEDKKINIYTGYCDNKYIISISNSVNDLTEEMIPSLNKKKFSTKGSGRGYGLYNVQNIVSKYKGKIKFKLSGNMLDITITI